MSFRAKVVIRVVIVLLLGFAALYILVQTPFWLLAFWFFLFSGISLFELIRFLEKSKRELADFLISVRQKDFSGSYSQSGKEALHQELHQAFKIITSEFQQLRKEKESNHHFLQTVVEHSGVPLVSYEEATGSISLMNKAAKELFKRPYMGNINALEQLDRTLAKTVYRLNSGERALTKIFINDELLHLSILAREVKLDGRLYKLLSFQNIKAELDEQEMQSWQKLIRVLTHEIKNSAIPISTLTEVINQMIIDDQGQLRDMTSLDKEDLDDLKVGMQTVHKRSSGLVNFVNAYGELAKVPQPQFQPVNVLKILRGIETLLKRELEKAGILLNIQAEASLEIMADPDMVEQILINLVKNAKEAFESTPNPTIEISGYLKEPHTIISVADNGPGIDTETLEHIFIPFFSTKKEGSGIGLSLSRQLMRAHKGNLTVSSVQGSATTFFMIF